MHKAPIRKNANQAKSKAQTIIYIFIHTNKSWKSQTIQWSCWCQGSCKIPLELFSPQHLQGWQVWQMKLLQHSHIGHDNWSSLARTWDGLDWIRCYRLWRYESVETCRDPQIVVGDSSGQESLHSFPTGVLWEIIPPSGHPNGLMAPFDQATSGVELICSEVGDIWLDATWLVEPTGHGTKSTWVVFDSLKAYQIYQHMIRNRQQKWIVYPEIGSQQAGHWSSKGDQWRLCRSKCWKWHCLAPILDFRDPNHRYPLSRVFAAKSLVERTNSSMATTFGNGAEPK